MLLNVGHGCRWTLPPSGKETTHHEQCRRRDHTWSNISSVSVEWKHGDFAKSIEVSEDETVMCGRLQRSPKWQRRQSGKAQYSETGWGSKPSNQIDPCNHQAVRKVGNRSHMKQLEHLGKDSKLPESWYDLLCPHIGNGHQALGHADQASTGFDQQLLQCRTLQLRPLVKGPQNQSKGQYQHERSPIKAHGGPKPQALCWQPPLAQDTISPSKHRTRWKRWSPHPTCPHRERELNPFWKPSGVPTAQGQTLTGQTKSVKQPRSIYASSMGRCKPWQEHIRQTRPRSVKYSRTTGKLGQRGCLKPPTSIICVQHLAKGHCTAPWHKSVPRWHPFTVRFGLETRKTPSRKIRSLSERCNKMKGYPLVN